MDNQRLHGEAKMTSEENKKRFGERVKIYGEMRRERIARIIQLTGMNRKVATKFHKLHNRAFSNMPAENITIEMIEDLQRECDIATTTLSSHGSRGGRRVSEQKTDEQDLLAVLRASRKIRYNQDAWLSNKQAAQRTSNNQQTTIKELLAARQFVEEVGSVEKAQMLIETLKSMYL